MNHTVKHKSHMVWSAIEPEPLRLYMATEINLQYILSWRLYLVENTVHLHRKII